MLWALFIIQLLLDVGTSAALSVGQSIFSKQGVTSLVTWGTSEQIFAGTKRGDLLVLEREPSGPSFDVANSVEIDSKTFPVYSLTSSSEFLFCGCGDRYVSVLNTFEDKSSQEQRLGPHTGWVKDLYYHSPSELLFSIGCNCIQSWKRIPKSEGSWEHLKKRSIESSPTQGSTLSSDLLCLCGAGEGKDYFYSGGVDGRIHVWSVDPNVKEPLQSIGAHAERLNCLLYKSNFLFSVGNDGQLQCRRAGPQLQDAVATLYIGKDLRVTAGGLLKSTESSIDLVLGCSNGALKQFHVDFDKSAVSISEKDQLIVSGDASIQALLFVPAEGSNPELVLVGHSKGLDAITL
jgi:WD40 repeat protein